MVNSFIRSGKYLLQDVVPDGIHATQLVYRAMGQLMAVPFVHPHAGLSMANQFVSIAEGTVTQDPAAAPNVALASRLGSHLISTAVAQPKSMKVAVRVDEPGLDIYIAYPIWIGGISAVGVFWDQVNVGTVNQQSAAAFTGSEFVHDQEVCIARNVTVGLHSITMSASVALSIGLSYIRARRTSVKKIFKKGVGTTIDAYRSLPLPAIVGLSSATDAAVLSDELPISRLLAGEGIDIAFTATLTKATAFILHGILTAPAGGAGPLNARLGIGIAANSATGFVQVLQITGENTYAATVVGAVDASLADHQYRLILPAGLAQSLQVFFDGALIGTVPIIVPYLGGFMGIWTTGASKALTIKDLRIIEH